MRLENHLKESCRTPPPPPHRRDGGEGETEAPVKLIRRVRTVVHTHCRIFYNQHVQLSDAEGSS